MSREPWQEMTSPEVDADDLSAITALIELLAAIPSTIVRRRYATAMARVLSPDALVYLAVDDLIAKVRIKQQTDEAIAADMMSGAAMTPVGGRHGA